MFSSIRKKVLNTLLWRPIINWNLGPRLTKHTLSTESALLRINKRSLEISTVIDIGASNGSWSEMAMRIFPKSSYFLIEAQEEHRDKLSLFTLVHKNVKFEIVAAGNYNGTTQFDNSKLFGGLVLASPNDHSISVPIKTVDSLVETENLKGPFLLKLDTHGVEKNIFEGAEETLKKTNLIVVETYNYKVASNCLRFHEIVFLLEEKGFRCIDISEPLFRKLDDSFWQIDLSFVRSDRQEFLNNNYD